MGSTMTSRERVLASLGHRKPDRLPVHYSGVPPIAEALAARLRCAPADVPARLGDDLRDVAADYCGPSLHRGPDGSFAGLWGEVFGTCHGASGIYQEMIHQPYAGLEDPAELDRLTFPSPDWYDYTTVREKCLVHQGYAVCIGNPGMLDFLNGIGRCRGQEQVLLDVATEAPVFLELVERRFAFYHEHLRRMLEAADGLVDLVWVGDDLGTQQGPIISPDAFDRLFADKYRRVFALAHAHGPRAIMHACGAVRPFIPRLIALGLDVLDVVQVSAVGMALPQLVEDFGADLCFSGTVCVQTTLPKGSVDEVVHEVSLRQRLFPEGGLILGPTNTIELGTPIENILALYEAAGALPKSKGLES